ncbi:MAG: T9SS type A sorting domain-containing protein [Parafilimonas sp.]
MKNKFLPLVILMIVLAASANSFSQSKKFFAVTGEQFGNVNWMVFRQADMDGSNAIKTLYLPAENNEAVYDAVSGEKIITNIANAVAPASTPQTCGCINNRMVAAIAYDAKNNRLYYTQMMGNQLRYLDLNSSQPKSYAVTTQLLKNFPNQPGEASVITRMVIASDNYGYALTNDNEHLIRFSLGKQTSITDLGNLIDAKTNGENSVKKQFVSWGGDLIADANGNLYLFAMQRGVYKINPNTRLATFIGQIKNMPEDYTVNAAMVEDGANVIVGSSTKTTNYYRVNLTTLEATELSKKTEQVYNVSDFANANFAFSKSKNENAVAKTIVKSSVNIYPNPVSDKKLNVQFSNLVKGKYVIQLNDMEGKTIMQKEVNISGSQTESLYVSSISAGMYSLRVINEKGESIYNNKVIVSR